MVYFTWEPDCYPGDRMDAGVALRCRARGGVESMLPCVLHALVFPVSNRSGLSPPPLGGREGLGYGCQDPLTFALLGIGHEIGVVNPQAMQKHRKPACHTHDGGTFGTPAFPLSALESPVP